MQGNTFYLEVKLLFNTLINRKITAQIKDKEHQTSIFYDSYWELIDLIQITLQNLLHNGCNNNDVVKIIDLFKILNKSSSLQYELSKTQINNLYSVNFISEKIFICNILDAILKDDIDYNVIEDEIVLYIYFIKILSFVFPRWKLNNLTESIKKFIDIAKNECQNIYENENLNMWRQKMLILQSSKNIIKLRELITYVIPYYMFFKREDKVSQSTNELIYYKI